MENVPSNELPRKLELLKNSMSILSTELVGTFDDDMSTFSYAYKFSTNQGDFVACLYDVFGPEDVQAPEGTDITKWGPGDKAFEKAWAAKVKDVLLAMRKDVLKNTLDHFKNLIKEGADPKEALRNLLLEDFDSESAFNNVSSEFKKSKVTEKIWKSVKL